MGIRGFWKPGAQNYRNSLKESGIAETLKLETYDGEIVETS
jgi:hypothetical protein